MDHKYRFSVRQVTAKPRSKRLRELGGTIVGNGGVSISVEGSKAIPNPHSHKHSNLDVLERVRTDDQDYICLNEYVEEEDNLIVKKERAKVGFADLAGALDDKALEAIMSTLKEMFLRKDRDDETPHSLSVGKNLSVGGTFESGSDASVGGNLDVKGKAIAKKGVQFGESFVPGILTGLGGNIDERGNAELESLVIRRFLEVPELRYNRVEVKLGDKWNASGAGIFESVTPDYDENGNLLMTGTGWLKLEDGEIGAIAVGDICMGIFHSMNSEDNATEDSDDGMGNFQYSGFYTCYFTITEITGGDNKEFRYQMRPTSDRWKLTIHPSEAMTFVSYGSFTRADRQTSMYQTRTYTRLLKGQNTWEIGIQNIAMQYGDLSNMNIHGESLEGYSLYCNNMYFTGKIQQMKPNGEPILTANDRGEWVKGTKYDFYDRVSHDGGLWLCINESGTNTEPKDGDSSWLCQVKSGQSVTAAGRWESSKVPYAANSIVTFHEKVFISNKETSEPPFGIFTDKDENRLTYMDGGYILVDTLIQSEDWDLLLDAPDLVDGKDGESVQVRYSSDKSNWHSTFVEGDVWMQQRVGDKAQWSDPIRIAGEQGAAGADGTYYDYQFAVNDSLDVAPTTGWQDTPPKVGIGQYLWMRTRFVDPNSQVENPWSVARIGGEKGRGVEKVTEYYQVSASNTTPPTTWVKDTMPEMTDTLKYLWNYEEVAYTDTEVMKTSPIVIGMYSKDGNGIKSVTETYGLTNDPNEQPTKWYADMPIPTKEVRYLWNKTVTEYTDGTPTTIIRIIAVHGETGDSIKAVGAWKSGLEVPALGVVTMAGKTFMAKVATTNPPMWIYTDKETNRFIYKNGGYILTGEMNTEEYDLLIESGKDGADGKDYEYIYIHSKDNTRPATPASVQIDDNVPSGWHDDPIGVSETFPYEWVCVRTKKDGIWSAFSKPGIWAKFGMDAILADLDNEMDNVALDSDGKTTQSTTIAITASMYYGSQKQALAAIQVGSVQGITSSYVLSSGVITLVVSKGVTLNERTEVPITLTSSINGKTETRTLKFTLAAVKGGADGKDAVLYDIVTSVSSIGKRKDGSYTVSGVSAVRMKTIGDVSSETTDGKLKYSIDGGAETEISNNQTISSDKIGSKIQFFFYNAEGVVVDKESVPLVVDGTDGADGKDGVGINSITTTYGKSTSASIMPTSWSGAMPSVGEGEYLWTRMVTDYTDPSKEDTVSYTYTYQGKSGQAGTSVSVKSIQYQAGTSPTTAPTGTWSNSMVDVPQGQYLWSKTTFSDGSVAYGVAKQGEDGKDGEGFTMMGNWKSDLSVPKMGVVTMGGQCYASKGATKNPPLWCWTDKDGNRLIFSATEYIITGESNPTEYELWSIKGADGKDGRDGIDGLQGIQGERGEQGIAGQDGKDGQTTYFHVKYAYDEYGMNMNEEGGDYIGTYVDFTKEDSTDPKKYTWVKTKGAQGDKGDQGIPGTNGENGETSYLHIAYANSADGKTGFSVSDSKDKLYIGQYTDFVLNDSTDPTKYKWTKIKGEQGEKGEKGEKGDKGDTGIQGCIIRDSEWAKGVEYRNDEDLTSGTRFIDIAMVRSDATATGWKVYKCKVTHTSSDDNKPENSTYWEAFGAGVAPIFTSLIIAKNAKINFLQGNQLLMQKNDGKVTAGLSGSEEGEKIRIWAGSDVPDNAPFSVTEEGVTTATKFRTGKSGLRLEAENGLISVFGNLAKNIEFGVDDEGLAVMRYFDNDGVLLYDLGPNGISAVKRDNDKWVLKRLTYLGLDEKVLFGDMWETAKNPYYNTGTDRFQFLSGYVGGAYNDLENNRKIFNSQSKTNSFGNSNVVAEGWYCDTLPEDATEYSRLQFPILDGILPEDMNVLNPTFNTSVPVYVTSAFYIKDGLIIGRMNVYYNLITA